MKKLYALGFGELLMFSKDEERGVFEFHVEEEKNSIMKCHKLKNDLQKKGHTFQVISQQMCLKGFILLDGFHYAYMIIAH